MSCYAGAIHTSYSLRDIQYTDYYGGFFEVFSTTGALMSALRTGTNVALIENNSIRGGIPTGDMNAAISGMINYCTAGWNGTPLPVLTEDTATLSLDGAIAPSTQRARQYLEDSCRTGHTIAPDAFLTGDLDGDGALDTAITPETYSCNGFNSMCGAAMCTTLVFLSSRPAAIPEGILGNGPRIEVGTDGRAVLRINQRCADVRFDTCPGATYSWHR